jgi:serine/threonine protein kinase
MASSVVQSATPSPAYVVDELTAAQLLTEDEGHDLAADYLAESTTGSSEGFCDFLVRRGVLTAYQAERLAAGEGPRLALGPYILRTPIGHGTLGPLVHAFQREQEVDSVVTVLPMRSIWHVHEAKKFVQAFQTIPPHHAVIPLSDLDSANGVHYLAWPYENGEPLDRILEKTGPLPLAEAMRIAVDVVEAMAFCHHHGIFHGCLKPNSVIVANDGAARVTEWGAGAILAENIADEDSFLDTSTSSTSVTQNLDYVPPETISDPNCRTPAGDQYSVGCLLYTLLTGDPPFPNLTLVESMMAHQMQVPEALSSRNSDVSEVVSNVVARMLRKAPEDRYPDWREPLAVLRSAAGYSGEMLSLHTMPEPPAESLKQTWLDAIQESDSHAVSLTPPTPKHTGLGNRFNIASPRSDDTTKGTHKGRKSSNTSQTHAEVETPRGDAKSLSPPVLRPSEIRQIVLRGKSPTPIPETQPGDSAMIGKSTEASKAKKTKYTFKLPEPVVHQEHLPEPPGELPPTPVEPPQFSVSLFRKMRSTLFGTPIPEVLQLSIFGPSKVVAGQTIRFQVFAHPPVTFESMKTLARTLQTNADLLAHGFADVPVARGESLTFQFAVANAGVGESNVTFPWNGQPLPKTFDVFVPWESQTGVTAGVLNVLHGSTKAAFIAFQFSIVAKLSTSGSGAF